MNTRLTLPRRLRANLRLNLLILGALLSLTACVTLEVGIEPAGTPAGAAAPTLVVTATENEGAPSLMMTPTPTPEDWVPPTPEPAFTPMPVDSYPVPDALRVAFVKNGDIWLWTAEEREAIPLTSTGDVDGEIKMSDDGAIVAFLRGDREWWMVNSDGSGERELVSAADFQAMAPFDPDVTLNHFNWVPGTHVLAFNTRLRFRGSILNDDLYLVDADTLERTVLLPPGEGGEFTYSPDGSQVAIVTSGDISLIDADGENRRDGVLTYTPIATHNDFDYYAQPSWAANGNALLVAIPPADLRAQPTQQTTVWHIPTDGTRAKLVANLAAAPSIVPAAITFSADLGFVAFVKLPQPENATPERMQLWLEVRRLENDDTFRYPDVGGLFGWAPNSRRFAFLAGRPMSQLQIGQYSGRTIPGSVDAGTPVSRVRWIDDRYYLFVAQRDWEKGADGDSFDILLGDIERSSTVLASMPDDARYDFAR